MARDYVTQQTVQHNGFGEDFGFVSFSGTDATVVITTTLSLISHVAFNSDSSTVAEFYVSTPSIGANGYRPTAGAITITRTDTSVSGEKLFYRFIGVD